MFNNPEYVNNVKSASDMPSFQTNTFNRLQKVKLEYPFISPSQSYEISSLVENLAFIYGPASATYIHNDTRKNFGEMSPCHELPDWSRNSPSISQSKEINRNWFNTVLHTDKRKFICDICWKGFTQKGSLKRHKLIHIRNPAVAVYSSSASAEHACSDCGKVFRSKSHLKQHSTVHFKEKPFICDICQKGFSRNSSLKRHTLTHSRNTGEDFNDTVATSSVKQEDRTCFECGKQYSSKSNMKRHALVHSK